MEKEQLDKEKNNDRFIALIKLLLWLIFIIFILIIVSFH